MLPLACCCNAIFWTYMKIKSFDFIQFLPLIFSLEEMFRLLFLKTWCLCWSTQVTPRSARRLAYLSQINTSLPIQVRAVYCWHYHIIFKVLHLNIWNFHFDMIESFKCIKTSTNIFYIRFALGSVYLCACNHSLAMLSEGPNEHCLHTSSRGLFLTHGMHCSMGLFWIVNFSF